MRSGRYIWRLILAFVSKFKFVLVIGVLIGVLGFVALSRSFPTLSTRKIERIGISGRVKTDDLPLEILHLLSHGLTSLDKSGTVKPALAESWEVSEDEKVWTFHLKRNLRWQDGEKIIAADIKYPYSDVTVETPDENTLVFKLQNPFSPFATAVSRPVFRKGLLGSGDWKVASRGLRLAGNYVESITLVDKKGNKKIFKFYPTEERTKLAFRLGSVDQIHGIFNIKPFDSWNNLEITENVNFNQYVGVFFNTQDSTLSEKSLRQALSYGIDKTKFSAPRAIGPISPESWAFNPQVKPYSFDADRAKEILKDLPKEQTDNLNIKLISTAVLLDTAEQIATSWNNLGVKTEVQVTSNVPEPGSFQTLLAIFDAPLDPDQYSIWHSTQSRSNITKLANPRIDKLLEDGRTEINQTERKNVYFDFQRFLVEESPAAFLYHPITYTISRK